MQMALQVMSPIYMKKQRQYGAHIGLNFSVQVYLFFSEESTFLRYQIIPLVSSEN